MSADSAHAQSQMLAGQHVAIVGASSGVGLALARLAAMQGAKMTLLGRDLARLRLASQDLANTDLRCLDLLDGASIESAVQGMAAVDHLVITAGTFALAPFIESSVEQWRATLEERVIGPLTLIKKLTPNIRRSIVLFSGGVARRPVPGCAVLAGAVAAVESMGRALSLELAPIRVNVVAPGTLDTPMIDKVLGPHKDRAFSAVAANAPARRMGRAEDAAHAALFLMTNPYMSAATIEVDGGAKLI
jgi:NAD(P)-dependent dehydrogenase (short-subunit alcohol dehydrogenase family)